MSEEQEIPEAQDESASEAVEETEVKVKRDLLVQQKIYDMILYA